MLEGRYLRLEPLSVDHAADLHAATAVSGSATASTSGPGVRPSGLGFTYEGRFRHHMVTKSFNRDTDWFSVTDAEWPAVRAAHERWLDPASFDADGRQFSRLSALVQADGP